ncbi:carbohydrate ABC transporter permease [Kallotenue papyrolyticum]|uniref:carbohydrate ABC transporter permease n=1 Tax=Kallotenue papyrolyticum TaxID=1325125 RepID=UPI0004925A8F|nr:carbohydrate ABC transporter permease [Kallotenue papyrolyticum]
MATLAQPSVARPRAASARRQRLINGLLVNGSLALLCVLWLIPTIGLLVSSFRPRDDILASGWWTVLPHRTYVTVDQIDLGRGTPLDQPIQLPQLGATVTDEQLRAGYVLPDGRKLVWDNRRQRLIGVQERQLVVGSNFTLANYREVLGSAGMGQAFITTLVVAIPSTVIPILIAAFAAHSFAWMRYPGRRLLFAMVVALLVVPLQVALIPILRAYTALNINGTYLAMWLAHTGFGLPLATYLLYNYISQLPRDIMESAYIDGASNFTIFTRLILPLSVPALASFAIFQFLWVWNDYLVALIFLGGNPYARVLTMRLADLAGSRGQDWHLLTAGAFISMIVPLIVFFSLQRYFVRGLLAGSVKG